MFTHICKHAILVFVLSRRPGVSPPPPPTFRTSDQLYHNSIRDVMPRASLRQIHTVTHINATAYATILSTLHALHVMQYPMGYNVCVYQELLYSYIN